MSKSETDILIGALENADYEWRPYSGRGMSGVQCVSVNLDSPAELYALGRDIGQDVHTAPNIDGMGRGFVAYWPKRVVEEDR